MAWPRNPLRPGPRVGPTGKQTSLHGDMQFVTENRTYWLVSSQALGAATSCCFCCCLLLLLLAVGCCCCAAERCMHTWLPYQDTGAQGQKAPANGPQPDPCHTCLTSHAAKGCTPLQPALEPQLPVSTLLFFLFCLFLGFFVLCCELLPDTAEALPCLHSATSCCQMEPCKYWYNGAATGPTALHNRHAGP